MLELEEKISLEKTVDSVSSLILPRRGRGSLGSHLRPPLKEKIKSAPYRNLGRLCLRSRQFFFFKWKCISFHLMRKELQVRESGPGHVWQSLGRPRSLQLKKCGEALLWNTTIHGWMYISVSQQSCSYKIFSGRCFSRSYREERIGFRYVLGSEKTNGTCVNTGQ